MFERILYEVDKREIPLLSMDDKYKSRRKIAGPGHVVEIDYVVITSTRITAYLRNE